MPGSSNRDDLVVRHRVRDMIADIITRSDQDQYDTFELLAQCQMQCENAGVPLALILDEDIDAFNAPPLVAYIQQMVWDPEQFSPVLHWLLENSNKAKIGFYIRRAAMMRGDDSLFQHLRHHIPSESYLAGTIPLYDAQVYDLDIKTFAASIQVHAFAALLRDAAGSMTYRAAEKSASPVEGVVEFIALGRAWELRIGDNSLTLKLMQGAAATIDARCTVLARKEHELLLPRATLQPLSGSGQYSVQLKPCFSNVEGNDGPSGFTDPSAWLVTGELHLTLLVSLSSAAEGSASLLQPVPSDLSDEEWEPVNTNIDPEKSEGWVKASWSGRDEEL
ncbi:hypothetical protein BKA62DRAFT_617997 [Auriculariales sp. MPI-PUGE-AT-0066]|nr:hypothetical protein BKA62DRAFT_617997 [Auriculariales sp. MPI-PUGE-AT-0066]